MKRCTRRSTGEPKASRRVKEAGAEGHPPRDSPHTRIENGQICSDGVWAGGCLGWRWWLLVGGGFPLG